MRLLLQAFEIQNMPESISENIPPEIIKKIKDGGGKIEAYCVAHPGESETFIVGLGKKVIKWVSGLMENIKNKIPDLTPVFYRHDRSGNSTENRTKIGEILKTIRTASGEVVSFVHRFAKYAGLELANASFEALIDYIGDLREIDGHEVKDHELKTITGLALGGPGDKPAFERATNRLYAQCFGEQENEDKNMPIEKLTRDDVYRYIQENKLAPTDFFDIEAILNISEVKKALDDKKGNQYQQAQIFRLQNENRDLQKERDSSADLHGAAIKELKQKLCTHDAAGIFQESIKARSELTDRQKAFIEHKRAEFSPEVEGDLNKQVNSFLDSQVTSFQELEKIMTPSADQKQENGSPGDQKKSNEMPGIPPNPFDNCGIPD